MPWEISEAAVADHTVTDLVGIKPRTGILRKKLARFLGAACPFCGVTMNRDKGWNSPQAPSRDHRIPESRGGLDVVSNIVVVCRGCNEEKGSLTVEEFTAWRTGMASRLDVRWAKLRAVHLNKRLPAHVRDAALVALGGSIHCMPPRTLEERRVELSSRRTR